MINIYKSSIDENILEEIESFDTGSWINIVAPKEQEIIQVSKKTSVPLEMLRAALDDEETSRVEVEGNTTMILIDIPFTQVEENSLIYDTYPLAIIHTDEHLITVCLKDSKIFSDFRHDRIKSFATFKKSRFILLLLQRIAQFYLKYLRQINKKSILIEKRLYKSMKNRELIQMLTLQKSLVYFNTSLKSNAVTLDKLMKMEMMKKYEDDQDLLEDTIIEVKQAIEMCDIYSDVLGGTMDAFASLISNNLNIVMKILASITIVLSIPQMLAGFFGMNVGGNPLENHPYGLLIVIVFTALICAIVYYFLGKKDLLK